MRSRNLHASPPSLGGQPAQGRPGLACPPANRPGGGQAQDGVPLTRPEAAQAAAGTPGATPAPSFRGPAFPRAEAGCGHPGGLQWLFLCTASSGSSPGCPLEGGGPLLPRWTRVTGRPRAEPQNSQHLTHFNCLSRTSTLGGGHYHQSRFADEGTEAQEGFHYVAGSTAGKRRVRI